MVIPAVLFCGLLPSGEDPVLSEEHGRINPCSVNAAAWFRSVKPRPGTVKLTDLVPNQRLGKSLSC